MDANDISILLYNGTMSDFTVQSLQKFLHSPRILYLNLGLLGQERNDQLQRVIQEAGWKDIGSVYAISNGSALRDDKKAIEESDVLVFGPDDPRIFLSEITPELRAAVRNRMSLPRTLLLAADGESASLLGSTTSLVKPSSDYSTLDYCGFASHQYGLVEDALFLGYPESLSGLEKAILDSFKIEFPDGTGIALPRGAAFHLNSARGKNIGEKSVPAYLDGKMIEIEGNQEYPGLKLKIAIENFLNATMREMPYQYPPVLLTDSFQTPSIKKYVSTLLAKGERAVYLSIAGFPEERERVFQDFATQYKGIIHVEGITSGRMSERTQELLTDTATKLVVLSHGYVPILINELTKDGLWDLLIKQMGNYKGFMGQSAGSMSFGSLLATAIVSKKPPRSINGYALVPNPVGLLRNVAILPHADSVGHRNDLAMEALRERYPRVDWYGLTTGAAILFQNGGRTKIGNATVFTKNGKW